MDPTRSATAVTGLSLAGVVLLELGGRLIPAPETGAALMVTGGLRLLQLGWLWWALTTWGPDPLALAGWPQDWRQAGKDTVRWLTGCAFWGILLMVALALLTDPPLRPWLVRLPARPAHQLLWLGVAGVLAPWVEEIVFRGLIFTACRRWGDPVALGISTALFVAAHSPDTVSAALQPVLGGCVFGIARMRCGQFVTPIVLHMAANLALFCLSWNYSGMRH